MEQSMEQEIGIGLFGGLEVVALHTIATKCEPETKVLLKTGCGCCLTALV